MLKQGAKLLIESVSAVRPVDGDIDVMLANGTRLIARQVVIACGAWSKQLVAGLSDQVFLDTERGYNTTPPGGAFVLQRQLIFGEHGFVVAPLKNGIRIGGVVKLGGLDLPPNYARADAMLKKAASFMPGLKTEGGKKSPDIVYAFEHGHLGLTQSAATAWLVAELIAHEPLSIDIAPFAADRF
ncbi:MAG: FAD-binding oxidoreductase [Candidatus Devosia symbiotica]|nr:FAD-binding oxidoreductase [Candidatus Devosia symbiotica]